MLLSWLTQRKRPARASHTTFLKPFMHHVIDLGQGSLSIMPKPSKHALEADLKYLKQLGITKVVSLLEHQEAVDLGLMLEEAYCHQLGLAYENYAIQDHQLPTDHSSFRTLSLRLLKEIQTGENIVIHCHGGIGRSGVLVCFIMMQSGFEPQFTIDHVSGARGFPIPDTDEQYNYILDFTQPPQLQ